ncbi:MAG: sulfonate ABC transporter substrate-binding protein, partial [Proteobacteria bacterium]|nr:sulfonate ABC transporter substrate-binding protein [Pseudomonadota bacterium]
PEVVVAFLKAVIEASAWVVQDPMRAAEMLEKWTGIEKEVQYLYFSKGGHLTLEPTIKAKWIEALKFDHSVLAREKQIPKLDMKEWIQDGFIRKAFAEMKMDYDKQLATIHDPKVENASLPSEVWHAREGIKTYAELGGFLKAVGKFQSVAQKLNATYVYDDVTGLKLFGKMAFYVKAKGKFKAFLRKQDAEAYAKKMDSPLIGFKEAITAATS